MSFSSNIKDELYQIIGNSRHCQMAELAAVLHYLCREDEQGNFYIYTDHEELLQKCYKLLLRTFAPRKEGEEKKQEDDGNDPEINKKDKMLSHPKDASQWQALNFQDA